MKLAISLLVVVLVISVESLPNPEAHRSKRGFRMGAADRFSHGFGKRTESDIANSISEGDNSVLMTTDELVTLLQSNPKFSYLVAKTIDQNEDGLISREELFPKFTE